MYAVTYKNRVVLGTIAWNHKYIIDVMRVRHNEIISIPQYESQVSTWPCQVNDNICIYPAEEDRDLNINFMVQQYHGARLSDPTTKSQRQTTLI